MFKIDDSVKSVEISKFKKDDSHLKEDDGDQVENRVKQ